MIWAQIEKLLENGSRPCLVTILRIRGSSPREAGARMIVTADGSQSGSIGGGALEWQITAEARGLIAAHPEGRGLRRSLPLGPALGQCCGGTVEILLEAFGMEDRTWIAELADQGAEAVFGTEAAPDSRGIFLRKMSPNPLPGGPRLHGTILHEQNGEDRAALLLFGAGHVGRALVLALAPLPFSIRWIDPRSEIFPSHMPGNVIPIQAVNPAREVAQARAGAFVLAMTHSHALDFDIIASALARPDIPYIGVIGSQTKRSRFESRLRALGHGETMPDRLVCPIGVPTLKDKHPAVIAAAVAVQLLAVREAGIAARTKSDLPAIVRD
jgi:xanthine dehydrogenase accessory factor